MTAGPPKAVGGSGGSACRKRSNRSPAIASESMAERIRARPPAGGVVFSRYKIATCNEAVHDGKESCPESSLAPRPRCEMAN